MKVSRKKLSAGFSTFLKTGSPALFLKAEKRMGDKTQKWFRIKALPHVGKKHLQNDGNVSKQPQNPNT